MKVNKKLFIIIISVLVIGIVVGIAATSSYNFKKQSEEMPSQNIIDSITQHFKEKENDYTKTNVSLNRNTNTLVIYINNPKESVLDMKEDYDEIVKIIDEEQKGIESLLK